jgi:hypothetical protein
MYSLSIKKNEDSIQSDNVDFAIVLTTSIILSSNLCRCERNSFRHLLIKTVC